MKNKHLLFLILALSVTLFEVVFYAYMYFMVGVSLDNAAKAKIVANTVTLDKKREQDFLQAYKLTASKWSKLPGFFVDSKRIVEFIEAVETLSSASNSNVAIGTIDADNLDSAPVGKVGSIRTHIEATGTWSSVMRALALAETLPYKISINNVHANLTEKSTWNLSFDLEAAMLVGLSK